MKGHDSSMTTWGVQYSILIGSMGHRKLRIVTHLDYKEVMHEYVMEVISKLTF